MLCLSGIDIYILIISLKCREFSFVFRAPEQSIMQWNYLDIEHLVEIHYAWCFVCNSLINFSVLWKVHVDFVSLCSFSFL